MFDDERIKRIVALAEKAKDSAQKDWNAEAIFKRLDEAIIGNKDYKQTLALCIAEFISAAAIRSHLLVVGPSGTGKTYLIEQTLPDFGLPYKVVDCSGLVPSGYKGNTLQESLEEFFKSNMTAASKCVVVLDEFDKISEKANGGDTHKSHSIQSELLTLIQGKQEGAIDTRNALWILLGAFAYTDEMKGSHPSIQKEDLLKYGFKNELLGRIVQFTMTDIPTVEEVVKRVAKDKTLLAFVDDMKKMDFNIDIADDAFLALSMAAQDPRFGMRAIPSALGKLKKGILFGGGPKGEVKITLEMVNKALGN